MPLPFNEPNKKTGRFILLAQVTIKPGKGAEARELLAKVRALSESSGEPGTHTYRTCQDEESPDKFIVFEEYDGQKSLEAHVAAEPFQTLAGADLIQDLKITYHQEFDGQGKDVK